MRSLNPSTKEQTPLATTREQSCSREDSAQPKKKTSSVKKMNYFKHLKSLAISNGHEILPRWQRLQTYHPKQK